MESDLEFLHPCFASQVKLFLHLTRKTGAVIRHLVPIDLQEKLNCTTSRKVLPNISPFDPSLPDKNRVC